MEILSNISAVQWVFIAIGAAIALPPALSSLRGFWPQVSSVVKPEARSNELTDLVRKWEDLSDACQSAGLNKACQTLDSVFPLLLQAREDATQVEPETT
tara:strand:- start:8509 stop:8805 length:297 start_codon:yes stop_codon:yes gene_type:complete